VLALVQMAWGWPRTLQTLLIIAVLTWLVEAVGSATGLPFGQYSYTDNLQPQLAHVPLIIPLAWFMMLPPAWAIAQKVAGPQSAGFYFGQCGRLDCLGPLSGPANGGLGFMGMGTAGWLFWHPLAELWRLVFDGGGVNGRYSSRSAPPAPPASHLYHHLGLRNDWPACLLGTHWPRFGRLCRHGPVRLPRLAAG
jgi:lycopene beta-cyclase